jgi:hypothetical protein
MEGQDKLVDRGVWSPSNIDAAEADPGDHVPCLLPTAVMSRSRRTLIRGLSAAFQDRTALEVVGARRRGATVDVVTPETRMERVMGPNTARRNEGAPGGGRVYAKTPAGLQSAM